MHHIKNTTSICKRDVGPSRAVTDVYDELLLPDIDGFEVKARACILFESPILGVERLCCGNQLPIDAEVSDGCNYVREIVDSGVPSCC